MKNAHIRWFCICIVFIILISSCADKRAKEEFSTPIKTYRLWLDSAERGDIAASMDCITEASKKIMDSQLKQMDVFMSRMMSNVKIFKRYSVVEEETNRDRAVVVLQGPSGDRISVPFVKEPEGWKVDLMALFGGNR